MIGFMHATNDAPGLWNQDFRPLRAPLPVLAIRHLVEQDAPFAARHKLLLVPVSAALPDRRAEASHRLYARRRVSTLGILAAGAAARGDARPTGRAMSLRMASRS